MADQMAALQSSLTCIEKYVKELEDRIKEANGYSVERMVAFDFITAFPEAMAPPPVEYPPYNPPRTSVGLTLDNGTVHALMINYHAVSLMELVEPVKWLANRLGKFTIEDYPELNRRGYVFSGGRLRFQVFFDRGDKTVCKFIQVGVKEEPVYKLQCEGENASQTI